MNRLNVKRYTWAKLKFGMSSPKFSIGDLKAKRFPIKNIGNDTITPKSSLACVYISLLDFLFFLAIQLLFSNSSMAQAMNRKDTMAKDTVLTLNFSGEKNMIDLMPTLKNYINLQSLDLSGSLIQDEDLVHVNNPKLYLLNLSNTLVTSTGISSIGTISKIRQLNLEGTLINNASMQTIERLHFLSRLDIGRTNVTDAGISHLKNSKISILDLTALKITDVSLEPISTMPNLNELYLWNVKVTFSPSSVQNLKNLKILMLAGSDTSNEGLRNISKLPELKVVNLSWSKVTDEGLKHLVGNQSIEVLGLSGTKITESGIKNLSKMKKLKILTLEDVSLKDSKLDFLLGIPHLKTVYLNTNSANANTIDSLVRKMPWAAVYYNKVLKFTED